MSSNQLNLAWKQKASSAFGDPILTAQAKKILQRGIRPKNQRKVADVTLLKPGLPHVRAFSPALIS